MLTLPTDTIISYVDFTKNYFYTMQDKIQSAYWHSYQVTIMVHITCRVDPDFVEGTLDVRIIKESHFWIMIRYLFNTASWSIGNGLSTRGFRQKSIGFLLMGV
jgi:hypothetical protein